HEAYILTKFSYTEDINLGWLNRYLWGNIILWLSFLTFEVIGSKLLDFYPHEVGFIPGFVVLVGLILYLGIYGRRQGVIFDSETTPLLEPLEEEVAEEKYQSSSLTDERAALYLKQLRVYMDREKPYLEPKMTIAKLAERADIPVNYLSQVINDRLDQNFFDFINSYRVREFQELLEQPDNSQYTLLSLAHDAGFNSKSTFNAIFKKFTGQTPSEYVRNREGEMALIQPSTGVRESNRTS
ncbi:MAG: AraC family transcriptional regulator, partial [Phaeodactylibacter sp.]|nr:AraC family transcriptional regulator [Phaeodactylibacter sp.]